jgi:hypothetical protein
VTASGSPVLLAASDAGKGSPIGLFVVLLLVIAVYLLYRSMSGHIRRLPEKFPGYQAEAGEADTPTGPSTELPVDAPPPSPTDGTEPPRLRPERPA